MTTPRKESPVTDAAGSRLRADARENQDRLLVAAARAFAREGTATSLKAIARDAGVGIATLYRRFPTREQLVWAVYRSEVDRICAAASDLLAQLPPIDALRAWMEQFLEFLASKHGMAEVLGPTLADDDGLRLEIRELLTSALDQLIRAGVDEHTLRADVAAADVVLALGGTALIAGEADQREQAGRLLDLLLAGLRVIRGPADIT
jgi:AcrR family transcriptional regulator